MKRGQDVERAMDGDAKQYVHVIFLMFILLLAVDAVEDCGTGEGTCVLRKVEDIDDSYEKLSDAFLERCGWSLT